MIHQLLLATMLTGLSFSVHPVVILLAVCALLYVALRYGLVPLGLTFQTNDDMLKYLISIGFLDSAGGMKRPRVSAKTVDYTLATGTDPSGTVFTNRGATATVIFTLPAPSQALAGAFYEFLGIADYTITVKTATADTLICINDITADSLSAQTGGQLIAARMRAFCDGTSWIANGEAVGHTYTVAT